jgi:predicted Fe-Mo cluster-binding NifX family protein
MKIAAVSEDGVTISQHFGRAPYYMVVTVEEGRITGRERRDKPGHGQFGHEHAHGEHDHSDPRHGFEPAAQRRHGAMAAVIADCQIVLARGMGMGAYESMKAAGIRPVVTEIENVDEAALAAAGGTIVDHRERLH